MKTGRKRRVRESVLASLPDCGAGARARLSPWAPGTAAGTASLGDARSLAAAEVACRAREVAYPLTERACWSLVAIKGAG